MWVSKRDLTLIEEKIGLIDKQLLQITDSLKSLSSIKLSEERLANLEIWQGKLKSLLIETTPQGREKLSFFGKVLKRKN